MSVHRVPTHLSRPVLHAGLFTDEQLLIALAMILLAGLNLFMGLGGVLERIAVSSVLMVPPVVIAADNKSEGNLKLAYQAWVFSRTRPGIYRPGGRPVESGYVLLIDPDEARRLADIDTPHVPAASFFEPDVQEQGS